MLQASCFSVSRWCRGRWLDDVTIEHKMDLSWAQLMHLFSYLLIQFSVYHSRSIIWIIYSGIRHNLSSFLLQNLISIKKLIFFNSISFQVVALLFQRPTTLTAVIRNTVEATVDTTIAPPHAVSSVSKQWVFGRKFLTFSAFLNFKSLFHRLHNLHTKFYPHVSDVFKPFKDLKVNLLNLNSLQILRTITATATVWTKITRVPVQV